MSVLERAVENRVLTAAARYGYAAVKLTVAGWVGWPDRMVLGPGRIVFFIEVKRFGHRPTAWQSAVHTRLRRYGFGVYVVDRVEDIDAVFLKESTKGVDNVEKSEIK